MQWWNKYVVSILVFTISPTICVPCPFINMHGKALDSQLVRLQWVHTIDNCQSGVLDSDPNPLSTEFDLVFWKIEVTGFT